MATPKKTLTANEQLLDALIRHQIMLMRLSQSLRLRIEKLLNATEADIEAVVNRRLANGTSLSKAQFLQRVIRNIRTKAWDEVTDEWVREANDIAKSEAQTVAGIMETVSPVILDLALPPVSVLRALVTAKPFQGRTLRAWAQQLARDDLKRIEDQIKIGVVQGETNTQIAQRIVGSARLRGRDGVTEITRRAAQAITRTSVNHIANWSKRELYALNSDIIDEELFVATLDSRTTPVCRSNDGKTFPLGIGPIPPLHWNCRSLRVAIFNGVVLGDRPQKPVTERMLIEEFAADRDLDGVKTRDDLPRGLKKAYDKFARARTRELVGQVPATTTYQTWLEGQSAAFQDDILGPTRGRLFRSGGLRLDQFVNRQGDELNLSDLARAHKAAFIAAGLQPSDFLN